MTSPISTKVPTVSHESPTAEFLTADLPLPDLPNEQSPDRTNSLKEIPPIHSHKNNSSLGGMDDSHISTTNKRRKRPLEDNETETEIKISRDT
ncbi:hypothetical protein SUVZ_06G0710 [Saccharomyces uvarum]|uniref:Uncharacterized protein n=1 Tax=Saccharomyces uvarum TaxID=230603 RepID=A0ABN8WWI3_SACUV|nr:hypothetical protein SUVZ_06G0710 [Saccharomyces uvarum]